MSTPPRVLPAGERAESLNSDDLFLRVYDELRRLAAQRLAQEKPGQTLVATALVHEVYIRLAGGRRGGHWDSTGHFFAAAAESMRRILVERARRKRSKKRGDGAGRINLEKLDLAAPQSSQAILDLDEAVDRLLALDPQAGQLVRLRYYAGLTVKQAGEVLGIAPRTTNQVWTYARAWLLHELEGAEKSPSR